MRRLFWLPETFSSAKVALDSPQDLMDDEAYVAFWEANANLLAEAEREDQGSLDVGNNRIGEPPKPPLQGFLMKEWEPLPRGAS